MADELPTKSAGIDPNSYPKFSTSYPDEIVRHNISDEELEMLCQQRSDNTREIFAVALGVAGGALPGTMAGLYGYWLSENTGAISFDNLAQVVLFFGGGVVAWVTFHIQTTRGANAKSLKEAIRARTKRASH